MHPLFILLLVLLPAALIWYRVHRCSVLVQPGQAAVVVVGIGQAHALHAPGRYYFGIRERPRVLIDTRRRSVRTRLTWRVRGVDVEIMALVDYVVDAPLAVAQIADLDKYIADALSIELARAAEDLRARCADPECLSMMPTSALDTSKALDRVGECLCERVPGITVKRLCLEATRA